MPTSHAPVAVVTGASSGIGAAAAERLTKDGYRVVAVARRADRLDELARSTGCETEVLDVRDSTRVVELMDRIGTVDVLVNNAGLGRLGTTLAESTFDDIGRSIDTNVTAVLVATMAVLPGMTARRRGHIVNIGSMAGLYPLAAATYGASKAALHRLSTNLRLELRGTGVRVTEICPGRVTTEFYDVAIDDLAQRQAAKATGIDELTPAEVADAIAYALGVPAHVNINRIELQPTGQTYGGSQFDPPTAPGAAS